MKMMKIMSRKMEELDYDLKKLIVNKCGFMSKSLFVNKEFTKIYKNQEEYKDKKAIYKDFADLKKILVKKYRESYDLIQRDKSYDENSYSKQIRKIGKKCTLKHLLYELKMRYISISGSNVSEKLMFISTNMGKEIIKIIYHLGYTKDDCPDSYLDYYEKFE